MRVQETLKKSQKKYKVRHDQHRIERTFRVEGRLFLQLNMERLQGPSKKIKVLWYGHFEVLKRWEITPTDSIYPHTCAFTQ